MLRLLSMSDRDKVVEILALRHQITVLERQLGGERVRFTPNDRAFLATLLHRLPRDVLRRLLVLVRPDTVLRWHRDLVARRHADQSRPKLPPASPGHRERPPAEHLAGADRRSGAAREPRHTTIRSPRWHFPRVRACRVTCADGDIGKDRAGPAPVNGAGPVDQTPLSKWWGGGRSRWSPPRLP
jgi:hypothetical protein